MQLLNTNQIWKFIFRIYIRFQKWYIYIYIYIYKHVLSKQFSFTFTNFYNTEILFCYIYIYIFYIYIFYIYLYILYIYIYCILYIAQYTYPSWSLSPSFSWYFFSPNCTATVVPRLTSFIFAQNLQGKMTQEKA